MENRVNDRKAQYKKTFDDPRRWREDVLTQIRKEGRTEALNKRRQGFNQPDEQSTFPTNQPGAVPPHSASDYDRVVLTDEEIQKLIEDMKGTPDQRNTAVERIRRGLSVEVYPPIDAVIRHGGIPLLMMFLQQEEDFKLQFESAWCLTNVASGDMNQTKTVIDAGGIPLFCKLLKSANSEMREQAVWAIGNLSGDNIQARDMILEHDALSDLKRMIQNESNNMDNKEKVPFLMNCTWAISNLLRGKPVPPYAVSNLALNLLHKLIYISEADIQSDACWAISYITDAGKVADNGMSRTDKELEMRINDVLFMGLGFRICELIASPYQSVQIPALRSAGNIVTGTDEQTQTMILSGIIPALKNLIKHNNLTIQKEAVWAISNITAGNRAQIQEVISYGLIPPLLETLQNAEFDIKKEAAWAVSNALTGGNAAQVATIVQYGALKPLCEMLKIHDENCTVVVLDAIRSVLQHGASAQAQEDMEENPYASVLEQAGGYDQLEFLSGFNEGPIRTKATDIVTRYLEVEDESLFNEDGRDGKEDWDFTNDQ
eukprot:GHVH01003674.1.p1 GENE.GHVH01003674.1~~GHVH01003674.1.p1  ORF type:complete len:545 (+),score=86.54 GHVH01003674.1:281-1915(+)